MSLLFHRLGRFHSFSFWEKDCFNSWKGNYVFQNTLWRVSLFLVTGAAVNFPGVIMTHHCSRLCWAGSLSLSNSLCVISIPRSSSVSFPSAKSLLRREVLLTCQRFSTFRHSPGNCLMTSLWQVVFKGDKVIDPEMYYKLYTRRVEIKQTHLCHSTWP